MVARVRWIGVMENGRSSAVTGNGPSLRRRLVALVLIVVGGGASVATSPPESASISAESSGVVVLDGGLPRVERSIEVELSGPALAADVGSLSLQVWGSGTSEGQDRPLVRVVLTGPDSASVSETGEELLVADGSSFHISGFDRMDGCVAGQPCTIRFSLLFERLDQREDGSVHLEWNLSADVGYDRSVSDGPPPGSQMDVLTKDAAPETLGSVVEARLPTERIMLAPETPSTSRTVTVFIPQELVQGVVSAEGVVVAALTPEVAEQAQVRTNVVGWFHWTDGTPARRNMHPVGATAAFDVLADCVPVQSGGCEIQKEITFHGCPTCEFPVSFDWWLTVALAHQSRVPENADIEFGVAGSLKDSLQEDTRKEGQEIVRYRLTVLVDTNTKPDSAYLSLRIGAASGDGNSLARSMIFVDGPALSQSPLPVRAQAPIQIPLLTACDQWSPCQIDLDIEVRAPADVVQVVWNAEVNAHFQDGANLVETARVDLQLESLP